jgi:hypothetical protein
VPHFVIWRALFSIQRTHARKTSHSLTKVAPIMVIKARFVHSPSRTISSISGVKHKRSDAEVEPAQRVLSALRASVANPISTLKIKKLVLEDLQSDDKLILIATMRQLKFAVNVKSGQFRAENAKEIYLLDGQNRVFDVMEKHADEKILQELGLFILANSASSYYALVPAIVNINGMGKIQEALTQNGNERSIQINGFSLLHNLVCNRRVYAEQLVVDYSMAPLIIQRMNEYKHDAGVLYAACNLLKVLCGWENLQMPLLRAKAAFALMRIAFNDDPEHALVKEVSREAIKRLVGEHCC